MLNDLITRCTCTGDVIFSKQQQKQTVKIITKFDEKFKHKQFQLALGVAKAKKNKIQREKKQTTIASLIYQPITEEPVKGHCVWESIMKVCHATKGIHI